MTVTYDLGNMGGEAIRVGEMINSASKPSYKVSIGVSLLNISPFGAVDSTHTDLFTMHHSIID